MTAKDFKVIAEILKAHGPRPYRRDVVYHFASELEKRFPRFKKHLFLDAADPMK